MELFTPWPLLPPDSARRPIRVYHQASSTTKPATLDGRWAPWTREACASYVDYFFFDPVSEVTEPRM